MPVEYVKLGDIENILGDIDLVPEWPWGGFAKPPGYDTMRSNINQSINAARVALSRLPRFELPEAPTPPDPPALPDVPRLPPSDPIDVMKKIAEALTSAETQLNTQGLIVANGRVEVSMTIAAGPAQADGKFELTIGPRPFN